MTRQEFYIDRFLCPIDHEIEFDSYGLAAKNDIFSGNMSFISEKDFCEKIERAVIISESGMGKTLLLRNLKEKYLGSDAKIFELSQYRSSPAELRDNIVEFVQEFRNNHQDGDKKPFVMLDALDEAETISGEISRYLSEDIKLDDIRLIITSRNRENAAYLIEKLGLAKETEKNDTHDTKIGVYKLTPPSFRDVEAYVRGMGENPESFFIAVENKSVMEMCANPLGLEFLLQSYREEDFAEKSIADIWHSVLKRMCDKSNATSARPKSDFSPTEKMDCACWIAMTMALQNKLSIYSGVETPNDGIHSSELEYDKFSSVLILETIQDTSLFRYDPSKLKSSFAHTTFFEHCAAIGITKFVNSCNWLRLLLRPDGKEFLRKFKGIVSRLALIDKNFRNHVLDIQPLLLSQFKDNMDLIEPEIFCKKIMKYYANEHGKYVAHRFDEHINFVNLGNKDNKVCDYLINAVKGKNIIKNYELELMIDIARDCACHDFADKLVDIVLGKIQATDDAYNVKISALLAISRLDSPKAKRRLYKKFDLSKEDDSRDELKGYYLRALWPEVLPTSEMVKLLSVPRQSNFSGGYRYFLSFDLPERLIEAELKTDDIALLLQWSIKFLHDRDHLHHHAEIASFVYSWCWQFADSEKIANLLADGYLMAVEHYFSPFPKEKETWDSSPYFLSPEQFQDNREARFKVLRLCLQKSPEKQGENLYSELTYYFYNHGEGFSLFNIEDAKYLFETLVKENDENMREIWKGCIEELVYRLNLDNYKDEIAELSLSDSPFVEKLKKLREDYENRAAEQQKYIEHSERRTTLRKKCQERRVLKCEVKTKEHLTSAECSWQSFPAVVNNIEWLERENNDKRSAINDFEISKSYFWHELNKDKQSALLGMARDYLVNSERFPDRDDNTVYLQPSQALCLLHSEANEVFENLSKDVWAKFANEIVRVAHHEEIRPILGKLSSFEEIFESSIIRIMKKREMLSMHRIGAFLSSKTIQKIFDEFSCWDEYKFHNLLCDLVQYTKHKEIIKQFVETNYADIENNKRYSYFFLMLALVPKRGLEVLAKMREHSEDCKQCLGMVLHQYQRQEVNLLLSFDLLVPLYIWLNENFPIKNEPHHEGVYSPNGIDEIYRLKGYILSRLQNSSSPEALSAIEEIKKEFPNEEYSYTYFKVLDNVKNAQSEDVDMNTIKKLYDARDSSVGFLIRTEKDLLDAVVDVLKEYQEHLQSRRFNNVRYLWNYEKKRNEIINCTPKCENDFSDHVTQFIKGRLEKEFPIVANREVKITPKAIPDIKIDIVRENKCPIEFMAEVKCSWNKETITALKEQLVDKYVKNSNSKIGLFVLACFESEHWTGNDKAEVARRMFPNGVDDAQKFLNARVAEQKTCDYDIRAVVVDCSLRN